VGTSVFTDTASVLLRTTDVTGSIKLPEGVRWCAGQVTIDVELITIAMEKV